MSDSNDDEIQFFSSILTASFIEIATLKFPASTLSALTAYEYLITLDQEVNLFWRRRITGATLLFLATRYLALLAGPILGAATFAPLPDHFVPSVMQSLVWAADQKVGIVGFSGLRTLALSGMNWALASAVFVLAVCPFGVNMWNLSLGMSGTRIERIGLEHPYEWKLIVARRAVAVARSCVIAADVLVIAVTWRSRLTRDRTIAGVGSVSSLGNILITNGTIYFLVIVILNTLHLALTCLSLTPSASLQIVDAVDGFSEVTTFTDPMTAILTWRFLLALQSADQRAVNRASHGAVSTGHDDAENGGTLRFASRVVGSAGASLPAGLGETLLDLDDLEEDEGVYAGAANREGDRSSCDRSHKMEGVHA
ncbi:hypothetical protein VTO73DRAFT_11852 [Trametes versicolor]